MYANWQTFFLGDQPPAQQGIYVIELPHFIDHVGQTDDFARRRLEHLRDRPYLQGQLYTGYLHVLPVWSALQLDGIEAYLGKTLGMPGLDRFPRAFPVGCPLPPFRYSNLRIAAALQAANHPIPRNALERYASAPPRNGLLDYVEAALAVSK
ncbi:MAG: hypothetical protein C0519_01355 [Hyphomicrobium sp.]|nr:hypothetical protein [Hyphomicrobium sp.]PPD09556.1 MAG: hypothetical protein CTY28_01750 [Hyphomicrobium sp.]